MSKMATSLPPKNGYQPTTLRLQAIALAVFLLRLALVTLTTASAQQQPTPPVALPGCPDKCGNISIPYPFGIGDGCSRDTEFKLECNHTYSPPRLTMWKYNEQIVDLSLDAGEARTYLNAERECYNSTRGLVNDSTDQTYMSFIGSTTYRFSKAKNRLVALGCPNLGYFVDASGYYMSGCTSVCRPSQYAMPGLCTGVGCCQSEIPTAVDFYEPHMVTFRPEQGDGIFASGTTACHYVFFVEFEWFMSNYSDREYLNRTDDFAVPVVLDWAVRNVGNCSAAMRNATDYACRDPLISICVDSTNGPGYRCKCSEGYEGNPYLDGGCRDIDECQRKSDYPCYGVCTNTPGRYICQCPPGTSGDATVKNGCRPKDKFTLALKLVIGITVGVFLSAFMCFWLYLGLQKRKLIRTKQKFFEQNGGVLLQQQMRSYSSAGAGGGFKIFSTEELQKATDNFTADRILGRGGHGIVYKGVLEDKTVVAIKKSKMMDEAQTKEFAREMFILSQINHRNVVKLLGCCLEVEVPMLVYEFVSNGTLYHYIHDKVHKADIAFDTRLRIAAESAEALAYMHSSASPPILHGVVKILRPPRTFYDRLESFTTGED